MRPVHQTQPHREVPGHSDLPGIGVTAGLPHGWQITASGISRQQLGQVGQSSLAGQIGCEGRIEVHHIRGRARKHRRQQFAFHGPPGKIRPAHGRIGMEAAPGPQNIGEIGVELGSQLQGPQLQGPGLWGPGAASRQPDRRCPQQQIPTRQPHEGTLLRQSSNCNDTNTGASKPVTMAWHQRVWRPQLWVRGSNTPPWRHKS